MGVVRVVATSERMGCEATSADAARVFAGNISHEKCYLNVNTSTLILMYIFVLHCNV